MESSRLTPVSDIDKISFPKEEEKILKLWKDSEVFKKCLEQSKDKPR